MHAYVYANRQLQKYSLVPLHLHPRVACAGDATPMKFSPSCAEWQSAVDSSVCELIKMLSSVSRVLFAPAFRSHTARLGTTSAQSDVGVFGAWTVSGESRCAHVYMLKYIRTRTYGHRQRYRYDLFILNIRLRSESLVFYSYEANA